MKRHKSSNSLAAGNLCGEKLPTIHDGVEDHEEEDELLFVEVPSVVSEKKRRLSLEQVRALEKNFEAENKLDPERKIRIATDLGLQPRQIAVWFQNRRARWKTKQLERDYVALQTSYDALAIGYDSLRFDKEILLAEIKEFKTKLRMMEEDSESKAASADDPPPDAALVAIASYKDGLSDSDLSAVMHENNSPYQPATLLPLQHHLQTNKLEVPQSLVAGGTFDLHLSSERKIQRSFFPKEEHRSDFLPDDQNLVFSWYCSDHWS